MAVLMHRSPTGSPEQELAAFDELSNITAPAALHAVLLALLLVPRSAHTPDSWQAWQLETGGDAPAQALWNQVDSLPAAARLPCFELLLKKMAGQPVSLRHGLLESTRRVMRSRGAARPIDRLHWLAMRFLLGAPALFGTAGTGAADLSGLPDNRLRAVASYSAYLSRMVPADAGGGDDAGMAWLASIVAPWREREAALPRRLPDTDALVHALHDLQALAASQRPMLVRSWTAAALRHSPDQRLSDLSADALRLTCTLLDCPLPAELARHYSRFPQEIFR